MVKNRVLICNNSLGDNTWRYLAPFYDVILPIDHVSLTLDDVTSFLLVLNVRNTCKRLHSKLWRDFVSAMAESWKNLKDKLLFHRFLCVRIEIDQLKCVNCWVIIHCLSVSCKQINHSRFALVIWSPLQLTSKQWIITQQFTARADLFLNSNTPRLYNQW